MADYSKKRKRPQEEKELKFQESWTESYYFVKHKDVPVCLLCGERLSAGSIKLSNIKRHYEKVHVKNKHKACELAGKLRKDKAILLKNRLQLQQSQSSIFKQKGEESEKIVLVSYALSELLVRDLKPFSHGDFLEKALDITADILYPEKKMDRRGFGFLGS